MKCLRGSIARLIAGTAAAVSLSIGAQEDTAVSLSITNGVKYLQLPLISGIEAFEVLTSSDLTAPFVPGGGTIDGYTWSAAG